MIELPLFVVVFISLEVTFSPALRHCIRQEGSMNWKIDRIDDGIQKALVHDIERFLKERFIDPIIYDDGEFSEWIKPYLYKDGFGRAKLPRINTYEAAQHIFNLWCDREEGVVELIIDRLADDDMRLVFELSVGEDWFAWLDGCWNRRWTNALMALPPEPAPKVDSSDPFAAPEWVIRSGIY